MRILVWTSKVKVMEHARGPKGIWAMLCNVLMPSGPADASSYIYHFYWMMGYCLACPNLWLEGSDNTQFIVAASMQNLHTGHHDHFVHKLTGH